MALRWTTRAWFPAVLVNYAFDGPWGVQPCVGAGLNYTVYTDGQVGPAYTAAIGGTITTATPGVGNIARTVDVRSDPYVVGLLPGYRY